MSDFTIVVNPIAGQGRGAKLMHLVEENFRRRDVSFEILQTTGPGDATEIARRASGSTVIAVGGDGTINEAVNGLLGTEKVLGIIPAGSGNDFIKSIQVPSAPQAALDTLFARRTKIVDVGRVECHENWPSANSSGVAGRYFLNGVGVGFDAEVAAKIGEIRWLTGIALYLLAVLKTLGPYRSPDFEISVDEYREHKRRLLVAIGNGRCAGGGFYLTPEAVVDDGQLDVCLVEDISIPKILTLMPRVIRGTHLGASCVNYMRGREILLCSKDRFFVHADGEIVGRKVQRVRVETIEKSLSVIGGWD